eukprot:361095-Chlamydomonas_euryale.AAC.11
MPQAIHRFGGLRKISQISGLACHRRPRGYWNDIDNVVREVLEFLAAAEKSTLPHASVEEAQAIESTSPEAASPWSPSRADHAVTASLPPKGVGAAATALSLRGQHLPTHKQLIKAGRHDLLTALQKHGHERVAKK